MVNACLFWRKKTRFVTALDLIKCLEQIKLQRLLLTSAPISELARNIITMAVGVHEGKQTDPRHLPGRDVRTRGNLYSFILI